MSCRSYPSDAFAFNNAVDARIAMTHCAIPGIVEEWDAVKQMATVRPAIQAKVINNGKDVKYERMPKIFKAPILVPYAMQRGLLLTIPLQKGDEGLIIFSDRYIDEFVKKGAQDAKCKPEAPGGELDTRQPRMHDLTDAIFVPGIITQPNVVQDWNDKGIEIRDKARKNFIHVGEDGIRLTSGGGLAEGGCDIRMQGGKMWIYSAEEYIIAKKESWTEKPPEPSGGGDRGITMPE